MMREDTLVMRVALEGVCCRKKNCRTCDGKRFCHGPYWYLRARMGPKKGLLKIYLGNNLDKLGEMVMYAVERLRKEKAKKRLTR